MSIISGKEFVYHKETDKVYEKQPDGTLKELPSNRRAFPSYVAAQTCAWLGEDGLKHFIDIKKKYGKINAVWSEGGIPHCVHFREGMSVRNFLRSTKECKDWTAHELDDTWVHIVEAAILYHKDCVKLTTTPKTKKFNWGIFWFAVIPSMIMWFFIVKFLRWLF